LIHCRTPFAFSVDVVGRLEGHVVTSREVEINSALESSQRKEALHFFDLSNNKKQMAKETSRVLLEWATYREAEAFGTIKEPSKARVAALVAQTKSNVGKSAQAQNYWRQLAPTDEELSEFSKRKIWSEEFIQFKTESAMVTPTDGEALEYYRKNRGRFGTAPFAQFKESILAYLRKEQAETRLREWFSSLQRRYRAQVLVAGEASPASTKPAQEEATKDIKGKETGKTSPVQKIPQDAADKVSKSTDEPKIKK